MTTHIGNKIKEVFEASGLKAGFLANQLNTSIRSVYYDFEKDTLPSDRISAYCRILSFNFYEFIEVSEGLKPSPLLPSKRVMICIEVDQSLQVALFGLDLEDILKTAIGK